MSRRTAYDWRKSDAEFAAEWDEAYEHGTCAMEDEMVRRAVEGVEKPVFHQGIECGRIREYSDTLLIFALKARRPEVYRERTDVNVTGKLTLADLVAGSAE